MSYEEYMRKKEKKKIMKKNAKLMKEFEGGVKNDNSKNLKENVEMNVKYENQNGTI